MILTSKTFFRCTTTRMSGLLRPKFPGRVFPSRSSAGGRRRLRTATMELNKDAVKVGENAARGIRSFYNMLGTESDEEVSWQTV